ncbi:leukocyte cell-derived chemotaxin-2-like isoform X3 [Lethenteron reissneri]|uniref:leukocyte cell-derived chemotaxin-2-like isoform X3 n=1 Tax=Lethenteron reissneri TaxID=7753 RepID=UPI002AB6FB11|nr:leukocyte cell-derived chemotaxin-2-like isoform X3 [Lethenteron reissneri]
MIPLVLIVLLGPAFSGLAAAAYAKDAQCEGDGGVCQYTNVACDGKNVKGRCGGPANRQCCMPAAATGNVKWNLICDGQTANKLRGCDKYGCGSYGACRSGHKHMGVDVECPDGSVVNAPFSGKVKRQAKPYKKDNVINDGVEFSNDDFCIKMFYIHPDRYTGSISSGHKVGRLLKMQSVYSGITSHVHIQMCDSSKDPTPYII